MPVRVTDYISTTDPQDTYATHSSVMGKGGYHEVADMGARDAITPERRAEGMMASVLSNGNIYRLMGGITNDDWELLPVGASDYLGKVDTIADLDDMEADEGQFVLVMEAGNFYYYEVTDNPDYDDLEPEDPVDNPKFIGKWNSQKAADTYSNSNEVPTKVGGVEAGTTFDNVPMAEVLNMLLYPYQAPTFSSFGFTQTTPLEVGDAITAGSKTFNWATTNSTNVSVGSISIVDVTGGNTVLEEDLNNTGSKAITIAEIVKTSAVNHVWRIIGKNTNDVNFQKDFTVAWQFRVYAGESAEATLDEDGVKGLRVTKLATTINGSYAMQTGGYKYIAYPASFGVKTTFKDPSTNMDVAMAEMEIVEVENAFGVTVEYNVHRTLNVLNGAITIVVS